VKDRKISIEYQCRSGEKESDVPILKETRIKKRRGNVK